MDKNIISTILNNPSFEIIYTIYLKDNRILVGRFVKEAPLSNNVRFLPNPNAHKYQANPAQVFELTVELVENNIKLIEEYREELFRLGDKVRLNDGSTREYEVIATRTIRNGIHLADNFDYVIRALGASEHEQVFEKDIFRPAQGGTNGFYSVH